MSYKEQLERLIKCFAEVGMSLQRQVRKHEDLRSCVNDLLVMMQTYGLSAPEDMMVLLRKIEILSDYDSSEQYIAYVNRPIEPQPEAAENDPSSV